MTQTEKSLIYEEDEIDAEETVLSLCSAFMVRNASKSSVKTVCKILLLLQTPPSH